MPTPGDAPLLWRIEREAALTDEAPLASLVSIAFLGSEYFLVARGDIPPVVGRPFDPELDIPTGRLQVSLEVGEFLRGSRHVGQALTETRGRSSSSGRGSTQHPICA